LELNEKKRIGKWGRDGPGGFVGRTQVGKDGRSDKSKAMRKGGRREV